MQRSHHGERSPFFEEPLIRVENIFTRKEDKVRVKAKEDDLLIMFKLVKAGYGDLETVKRMNAREVLQAIAYETFLADYSEVSVENC